VDDELSTGGKVKDELRRMAMFGSGVVELTRYRAEQMVKGFVKSGEVSPGGAQAMVADLLERSRQTRRELTRFVREEIKNQIEGLGLASKRDLDRMERRVTRLEDNLKKVRDQARTSRPSTGTAVGDSPGTKPKSTTKKTTARKSTTRNVGVKKTTTRTADAITDAPAPRDSGGDR
jgi:polyhydroxyalkanoate synthesis regulator phasin